MKHTLAILSFAVYFNLHAQEAQQFWHHADIKEDGIPGISLNQALDYLEGRPSKRVLVAIIDSGYEIDHDAFEGKLWVNAGEIVGNGKDDDGNGFVDDVNGWNFLGGAEDNIVNETLELTREYRRLKPKYENAKSSKSKEYRYWKEVEANYLKERDETYASAERFFTRYNDVTYSYNLLSGYTKVDTLSVDALNTINSEDSVVIKASQSMMGILTFLGGKGTLDQILESASGAYEYYDYQYNYAYNLDFDPRDKVGDDPSNLREKGYGNNAIEDVRGYGGSHGTHVAGIVGGEDYGVTSNVEFMFIRAVPGGDERDKDVANAIFYAVDNGAQVINMSFGKDYSPNEDYVREAVAYAESKGVLMIHAAGNDGKNNDKNLSYPDGSVSSKKKSGAWIEVGASSQSFDEKLPASFSNYGKNNVDLFAPGVGILSSVPGNTYEPNSGTSMAAPVVAGISALLLSYFPDLEATEIKNILMRSAKSIDLEVIKPRSEERVKFSELSKAGGIVNAYEAVKLADQRIKILKK